MSLYKDLRPEAQRRIYSLRPERLAELDAWLARYRRFWSEHLDALEAHLAHTDVEPIEGNDPP